LILLAIALLSVKCVWNNIEPDYGIFSDEFIIKVDETVMIENPENTEQFVNVTGLEINDSRCPSDAVCVRFGEAKVKVGVSGMQEILKTLDFCIGDCFGKNKGFIERDTVDFTLDNKNYSLILKEVNPYPNTQNTNQPKEALLRLVMK